ncbi:MAG TPA: cupin [bacterium]|mgnify:CR=1 FL=1|nr:cupin [bacterium]
MKKYYSNPFETKIEKPWGHEIVYTPKEAPSVGKILYVKAGKRLSLQYHDEKIETLCLIKGEAIITLSDNTGKIITKEMELEKGYFIQPGQIHRVEAVTDIIFVESSTRETGNTYRLEDDFQRNTETETERQINRGWK